MLLWPEILCDLLALLIKTSLLTFSLAMPHFTFTSLLDNICINQHTYTYIKCQEI